MMARVFSHWFLTVLFVLGCVASSGCGGGQPTPQAKQATQESRQQDPAYGGGADRGGSGTMKSAKEKNLPTTKK